MKPHQNRKTNRNQIGQCEETVRMLERSFYHADAWYECQNQLIHQCYGAFTLPDSHSGKVFDSDNITVHSYEVTSKSENKSESDRSV